MKKSIIIKTKNNNTYLYSKKKSQMLLISPILGKLLKEKYPDKIVYTGLEYKDTFSEDKSKNSESRYYSKKLAFLEKEGYLDSIDEDNMLSGRITGKDIIRNLKLVHSIVFEVTDRCNLKCKYCAFGELYNDYDVRENKDIDLESAKKLIDYIIGHRNISKDIYKSGDEIKIGFYGGEPLLNISFIKEIVRYTKTFGFNEKILYNMTTNAVLLDKHMKFLAENNFELLISLDGNKANSEYRVFHNGEASFDKVINNVLLLKENYPEYFSKKVMFNTVLHNKNNVEEIFRFFKNTFDKMPLIASISDNSIAPGKEQLFEEMFESLQQSINKASNREEIEKEMKMVIPRTAETLKNILSYSGYYFKSYSDLMYNNYNTRYLPTGTCSPFTRRIFMNVNGKLLPCERIGHIHYLGIADKEGVKIDYEAIAQRYNEVYDKLRGMCKSCYNVKSCGKCIFVNDQSRCESFMNQKEFSNYMEKRLETLEENPELYYEIMHQMEVL